MAKKDPMVWIILGVAAILLWQSGVLDGIFAAGEEGTTTTKTTFVGPDHYTEDTTVTLSSWDLYAIGTEPSVGHLIVQRDGERNRDYAEDATFTATPGDKYIISLGNVTTGGSYAPFLASGIIPDKGTFTIAHGLPAYDTSVSFTYWNEDASVNTAQAMDASTTYTLPIRLRISDNQIFGNPQCKSDNLMCIEGNATTYTDFELVGGIAKGAPTVFNPLATTALVKCYTFEKLAENDVYDGSIIVRTATTAPAAGGDNINITIYDAAFDFDADTLEIVGGTTGSIAEDEYDTLTPICTYEDEDNNDIGDTTSQQHGILVT